VSRMKLSDWAAIAEIVGAVAVVVSLLFVAFSLNRNTAILYANNEDFLYQLQDDEWSDLAGDPQLAAVIAKFQNGEEFSASERIRYEAHINRMMNRWEMVYYRYREGLMTEQQWIDWDRSYRAGFSAVYPPEWWPDWRHGYGQEFANHIDNILAGR
jgi:hypothetical protein